MLYMLGEYVNSPYEEENVSGKDNVNTPENIDMIEIIDNKYGALDEEGKTWAQTFWHYVSSPDETDIIHEKNNIGNKTDSTFMLDQKEKILVQKYNALDHREKTLAQKLFNWTNRGQRENAIENSTHDSANKDENDIELINKSVNKETENPIQIKNNEVKIIKIDEIHFHNNHEISTQSLAAAKDLCKFSKREIIDDANISVSFGSEYDPTLENKDLLDAHNFQDFHEDHERIYTEFQSFANHTFQDALESRDDYKYKKRTSLRFLHKIDFEEFITRKEIMDHIQVDSSYYSYFDTEIHGGNLTLKNVISYIESLIIVCVLLAYSCVTYFGENNFACENPDYLLLMPYIFFLPNLVMMIWIILFVVNACTNKGTLPTADVYILMGMILVREGCMIYRFSINNFDFHVMEAGDIYSPYFIISILYFFMHVLFVGRLEYIFLLEEHYRSFLFRSLLYVAGIIVFSLELGGVCFYDFGSEIGCSNSYIAYGLLNFTLFFMHVEHQIISPCDNNLAHIVLGYRVWYIIIGTSFPEAWMPIKLFVLILLPYVLLTMCFFLIPVGNTDLKEITHNIKQNLSDFSIDLLLKSYDLSYYIYEMDLKAQINEFDTHYYVYLIDDTFIIVFQGSVSRAHMDLDFDYHLTDITNEEWFHESMMESYVHCEIHSGFLKGYRAIRDELWKRIKLKANGNNLNDYRYICTGHSLGGALGVMSALDIQGHLNLNRNQLMIYTFGQPKVGNKAFAQTIDDLIPTYYRVVHCSDVVPNLPAMEMFFGSFCHGGKEIFIHSSGKIRICRSKIISSMMPGLNIFDHQLIGYGESIDKLCYNILFDENAEVKVNFQELANEIKQQTKDWKNAFIDQPIDFLVKKPIRLIRGSLMNQDEIKTNL